MSETRSAADYNAMTREKPGRELPDDPKPVSADALNARRRAIQTGRLLAPSRDELKREQAAFERASKKVRPAPPPPADPVPPPESSPAE